MPRKPGNSAEHESFLRKFGRRCIKCGKYTVSGSASINGKKIERKAICDNCGHTWKI